MSRLLRGSVQRGYIGRHTRSRGARHCCGWHGVPVDPWPDGPAVHPYAHIGRYAS